MAGYRRVLTSRAAAVSRRRHHATLRGCVRTAAGRRWIARRCSGYASTSSRIEPTVARDLHLLLLRLSAAIPVPSMAVVVRVDEVARHAWVHRRIGIAAVPRSIRASGDVARAG